MRIYGQFLKLLFAATTAASHVDGIRLDIR